MTKHEALLPVTATRIERHLRSENRDLLADETPVALVYNGRPHAVMMATPADLDDFAVGFSLSEGIVDACAEIEIVDRLYTDKGISLQMLIPQRRYAALGERQRSLTGRSGCGLCGTGTLEAAIRPVRRVAAVGHIDTAALLGAFTRLAGAQPLNAACGALHAAAVLLPSGELLVREDVGRHNAVDKVIGACLKRRIAPAALLVTSRASYEVVHKAAQVGCSVVAAISAPTALAVKIAREAGMTLAGFAREERLTIYTTPRPDTTPARTSMRGSPLP